MSTVCKSFPEIDCDLYVLFLYIKRVEFKDEVGLDRGGLAKELFTIAIRDLIRESKVLSPCCNGRVYWFTRHESTLQIPTMKQPRTDSSSFSSLFNEIPPEYLLGLLTALAVYNGIFVNLPLPPAIYKVKLGKQVSY